MSKDMNLVVLIGRLVRDPEIRYTPSGTPIAKFSIANGERFKQNNEWKDYTNYFDVVVWGNQAVNCEKYLKKGSQVSLEGSLRQNRWNDQASNQTRSKVEIIANSIQFLNTTPAQSSGYQQGTQSGSMPSQIMNQQQPQKQYTQAQAAPKAHDEIIPDPWGDSNFGNSQEDYPSGGFDSDDDIPF